MDTIFSSIMLAFHYLSVSVENVSVTSKTLGGDNRSMLCVVVIPNLFVLKLFASSRLVNEIVAITKRFVTLLFTTPTNVSELNSLHCKERSGISHTVDCSFF